MLVLDHVVAADIAGRGLGRATCSGRLFVDSSPK